jgi:hypothetical protein
MLIRGLAWLIALVALACPPLSGAHAGLAIHHTAAATADCPDHVPPPQPCPAQGTAKHAAGACCAMMAGMLAVLPGPAILQTLPPSVGRSMAVYADLTGLLFTKDPPPPRA